MGIADQYEAARTGAIWVRQADYGRIRSTGRDRVDLIHRMSTNDLTGMQPGEARPTVLTTAIARIVDLVWVLNYPVEALLLTSPGQGEAVRRWLSRYIFFQDEVVLQDRSSTLGQFGLFGPRAAEVAEALMGGAASLADNHFLGDGDLTVLRNQSVAGCGYTVLGPADQTDALIARAEAAGAVAASDDTFQILRVEAGQPFGGHELTEGYIPLEANLWHAVSFSKGCYIGQEIIARMESRGRLAKTLVGLKLAAEVPVGAEVRRDGASVGVVSSVAVSPRVGPVGLAFVKPANADPGTVVQVDGVEGQIAALPLN